MVHDPGDRRRRGRRRRRAVGGPQRLAASTRPGSSGVVSATSAARARWTPRWASAPASPGERAAAPALRRGHQARRVRRAARCCCPTRPSWCGGRAGRPRTPRPTRWAARHSAGSPTRRRRPTRQGAGDAHPVLAATPPATPTWPGPGSPAGGRCSPRRSTRTRARCSSASVTAERISPSADLLVGLARDRLKCEVARDALRGPGHHRGGAEHRAGRHRRSPAPTAGWPALLPRRAGPPVALKRRDLDELLSRSCGAWTPTTSTPRP